MLKDENGKVVLTLNAEDVIFLTAEDNYTSVSYFQNGILEKKLIRTSLKRIEQELPQKDFIRIHRSYMINLKNINSVIREKGKLQIQMNFAPDTSLAVSTTYREAFESALNM